MNNRHLFRGKRLDNGEWVTGLLGQGFNLLKNKFYTRSWETKYRGKIAIHAAVTPFQRVMEKMFRYSYDTDKRRFVDFVRKFIDIDSLCYGAIVATADLIECYRVQRDPKTHRYSFYDSDGSAAVEKGGLLAYTELFFGDWTPGRYAWELANVTPLPKPVPCRGKQGLWNAELEV